MNQGERAFIRACVGEMVSQMRLDNPRLVPGEIYDAIAQELERRCRFVINMQLQANSPPGATGLMSEGVEGGE